MESDFQMAWILISKMKTEGHLLAFLSPWKHKINLENPRGIGSCQAGRKFYVRNEVN